MATTDSLFDTQPAPRLNYLGTPPLGSPRPTTHTTDSTPIQRIPAELLREIFLRCLPKERHPSTRLAPLLLCQICSHWRSVALSLNHLWDDLCLLYDYSDGSLNNAAWAVKYWFGRAGEYSSLSFTICYADRPLYNRLLEETLIPLAHRFHHVDFAWDGRVDLMPFFALSPKMLKSAAFRYPGSPDVTSITHIDVTSLRKVSLSSVTSSSLNPELCDKILVWDRLTHLIITEMTDANVLVELLAQCLNLRKVACVVAGVENRILFEVLFPTLNQHVTLPYLHHFEMNLYRETNHSFLPLFRLQFPVLHRFRLSENSSGIDGTLWGEGTHFISQLSSIKDLGLSGYTLTPNQLLDTLRLNANFVTLDLDIRVNHEELFRTMTRAPNDVDLFPLLEDITIHLKSSDLPTFSSAAFVDMVRSRQMITGPGAEPMSYIRSISISAPPEGQPTLDDVKILLRKGESTAVPADKPLNKNIGSHPFSIMDIDISSW